MASKFVKGEKVFITDQYSDYFNQAGVIVEVDDDKYRVELEDDTKWFDEEDLCPKGVRPRRIVVKATVTETTLPERSMNNLTRLSNLAKKVLSADTKAMLKVGWLNEDLTLTEEGADVVISEYFSENEKKFGAMATAALKERKEDEK